MKTNVPKFLIVHHTGGTDSNPLADTSHHTFEIVDTYHKGLWNFKSSLGHYIGYHYFIDKSGKVTQGRADSDEGAHTKGKNLTSIGICLAGNFDAQLPTTKQKDALRTLLGRLSVLYGIPKANIVPHRAFANKTCYGKKLGDTWAADLLKTDSRTDLSEYSTVELVIELQKRLEKMTGT